MSESEWKNCSRCRQDKPLSAFGKHSGNRDGRQYYCRTCRKAVYKPDHGRSGKLKQTYGISAAEYEWMHEAQGGVCAICQMPERTKWGDTVRRLAVDHDHATGRVRALLCSSCNNGLGRFNDDPERLEAAASYLRRHDVTSGA